MSTSMLKRVFSIALLIFATHRVYNTALAQPNSDIIPDVELESADEAMPSLSGEPIYRKGSEICNLSVACLKAQNAAVSGNELICGNLGVKGDVNVGGNVSVSGTITGSGISSLIDPAALCIGGAVTFPCNVLYNSPAVLLNVVGDPAEQLLGIIRGTIDTNLTASTTPPPTITSSPFIVAGAGFTVTGSTTGVAFPINAGTLFATLTVTFSTPFTNLPSITIGTEDSGSSFATLFDYRIINVTTSGFQIEVTNLLSGFTVFLGGIVNFIAIGPVA